MSAPHLKADIDHHPLLEVLLSPIGTFVLGVHTQKLA